MSTSSSGPGTRRAREAARSRSAEGPRPRQLRLEAFGGDGSDLATVPTPRPDPLPGVWQVEEGTVVHPLLAPRTIRAIPFQIDLARIGLHEDLLVVVPTGLGKTIVAELLAAELLRPGSGKMLFLAPTRPLVRQHSDSFVRAFRSLRVARFTGTVSHPVREGSWDEAEAVFATPQLVENDLREGRYDLKQLALIVFDEAHHAVGKYAYVPIATRFRAERARGARLLGLTASPGGRDERIQEVVSTLGVVRIEARTREDEGVRERVHPVDIEPRWVEFPPELDRIRQGLLAADREEARKLQRMGYLRRKPIGSLSVKDLVALRAEIFARPGPMVRKFGPLFHQLILLHLHHALERLETQGVEPFVLYLDRVAKKEKPSRGDKAFLALSAVAKARKDAEKLLASGSTRSHPKIDALLQLLEGAFAAARDRPPRVIVFAQYRDTITGLQAEIEARGWSARRFVGQATRDSTDPGMGQREQHRVLEEFRAGRFPILLATSVAEEGLDVPDVDIVVFFESTPSEIRTIQRRGRTGRSSAGRVVLLLTSATREEGFQRAEARREEAMRRIVRRLSREGRARSRARGVASEEAPTADGSDRATAPGDPPGRDASSDHGL